MKEIIGSLYTEVSDRFQKGIIGGGISRTIKAEKHDLGVVEMEVKVIGQMDNTIDHTFESANRVYDVGGCSPIINTCGGGGLQPKIIDEVMRIGNLSDTKTQSRTVYKSEGISPTLCSGMDHGNTMPHILDKTIVAMRGRNPDNPSDRTVGAPTEQRLEPNSQGLCNTLTSVQKDNLVMEKVLGVTLFESDGFGGWKVNKGELSPTIRAEKVCAGALETNLPQYRIRKLTPRECWRLMDFTDEDFEKAAQVNSNTQLYKQAGNSIIRNVLVAILGQMIPDKEDVYKKLETR